MKTLVKAKHVTGLAAAALMFSFGCGGAPGEELEETSELGTTQAAATYEGVAIADSLDEEFRRIDQQSEQGNHLWVRAKNRNLQRIVIDDPLWCGGIQAQGCYYPTLDKIGYDRDVLSTNRKWQVVIHELVHAAGYNPHGDDQWRVGRVCNQLGVCCPNWNNLC